MTTIIENLTNLMTTTPEEDKQYLNEVIEEIKVKRPRGRPRIYPLEEDKEIKVKRGVGRPRIYTPEEALERKRERDRRLYSENPAKKIDYIRWYRQQRKLLQ